MRLWFNSHLIQTYIPLSAIEIKILLTIYNSYFMGNHYFSRCLNLLPQRGLSEDFGTVQSAACMLTCNGEGQCHLWSSNFWIYWLIWSRQVCYRNHLIDKINILHNTLIAFDHQQSKWVYVHYSVIVSNYFYQQQNI